jgi:hypothetical protein
MDIAEAIQYRALDRTIEVDGEDASAAAPAK